MLYYEALTIVPHNIDIHGCADDHALKKSFNAAFRLDECDTIQALTDVTKVIKQWMDHNRLKMNDGRIEFIIFGSSLQTVGDRAFSIAGPREWNRLPGEIRDCQTLGAFKRKLKTHLFRAAYGL